MSTRTEFKDDVVLFTRDPFDVDDAGGHSQDEVFSVSELDPESWEDWHSEKLLNVYLSLIEFCEDVSNINFMNGISFNRFCEFVRNPCPGRIGVVFPYEFDDMYDIVMSEFTHISPESFCTFLSDYTK
jgi:hypothetical protein